MATLNEVVDKEVVHYPNGEVKYSYLFLRENYWRMRPYEEIGLERKSDKLTLKDVFEIKRFLNKYGEYNKIIDEELK